MTVTGAPGLTSTLPQAGVDVTDAGPTATELLDAAEEVVGAAAPPADEDRTVRVEGPAAVAGLDAGDGTPGSGNAVLTAAAVEDWAEAAAVAVAVGLVAEPPDAVHADTTTAAAATAANLHRRTGETLGKPDGPRVAMVILISLGCIFASLLGR